MKFIYFLLCFSLCSQFIWADTTQTAQERISQLENEIESTQKRLNGLKKDKATQEKKISNLNEKIKNLQNKVDKLNEQKITKEHELSWLISQMNQNEINISENKNLLCKLIKNLNRLNTQYNYLDKDCLRNINIINMQNCTHSILANLDSLHQNYLSQKQSSKKKEQYINNLTQKAKRNQQFHSNNILQKESEKKKLKTILNIESDYQNQITTLQKGVNSLQDFIEQIEAEKRGRVYSFRFNDKLIWPLRGKLLQGFGIIKPDNSNTPIKSEGIYIQAEAGTPVKSIASGIVAFSGWFERKGNLVIVDHQNGFYSLYGFNKRLTVHKGQRVKLGEIIAYSGNNTLMGKDCLYFELRKSGKPVNPLDYLK